MAGCSAAVGVDDPPDEEGAEAAKALRTADAAVPVTRDQSVPEHVRLSSLLVSGGVGALYPAFEPEVLHYALRCEDTGATGAITLRVQARAKEPGTRLTLNGAAIEGSAADAAVEMGRDHDVAIRLTDEQNEHSVTYVVHCLPAAFPDVTILEKTDQVKDGLLLVAPTYGGYYNRTTYLAILDNNGVPRFHRLLTDTDFWALNFQRHRDGRYSVARRPTLNLTDSVFGNWELDLLDDRFDVMATVRTAAPLTQTDGHDFRIAGDGDYLLLSYVSAAHDFSEFGSDHSTMQATRDSVIQRRTPGGEQRFSWNSWDHRDVLQVGHDCRVGMFPDTYAHVNSLQLLADGDLVASFRGCSQVLRIDGSTGAVKWKLGGTAPSAASGAEHLEIVVDDDREESAGVVREFCGQHHATLTAENTVVLFDNGVQCLGERNNAVPFTRAVEYDVSSGTQAVYRREFRLPDEHGYAPFEGGVAVLQDPDDPDDVVHWLISWGIRDRNSGSVTAQESIAISEVDPETGTAHLHVNLSIDGQEAWSYRAYRVAESAVSIPLNLP